ncbi:PKD domain-containing protein [Nocardioides sp.]|uniref:PKD domain-containing protein n=1 Tax=Nocardioides sp. TaxID=35761 RepID=UPI003D0A2F72
MIRRYLSLSACALMALSGLLFVSTPAATAVSSPEGKLVSATPATFTPGVQNGAVNSIVQVGDQIILGGTFTSVKPSGSNQTAITRNRLVAFNATTGQISSTFNPAPNGEVTVVLPAADGTSVYVGGSFTTIGGVSKTRLAKVRVSDGAVLTTFNAGTIPATVKDLRLSNGRLWVAGTFTKVGKGTQGALTTLDPLTGAAQTYMTLPVTGIHNSGVTSVNKIDISPDGTKLVAIGNFNELAGVVHQQVFMLDLTGASAAVADWNTTFYAPPCAAGAFDTYMRDLDFSPDGSFFVLTTTGAYGGQDSPCDTQSRWESNATGTDVRASWVDTTGGDTTYAVEVTPSAVYVGGHMRWENNSFAGDTPGPGAVSREGIAALDPINGLPLSWNPTRTRGVGVFDFLFTSQGLWVGSDTSGIGGSARARIALMPANGTTIPAITTPTLPNDIYLAGQGGQATDPSVLYRVNAAGPSLPADTGIDWAADTDASPSPYHNGGMNRAGYGTVPTLDASVPAGTPREVFSTELWDGGGDPEEQWDFPVTAGTPLQVNLYFANRCSCTAGVGQRIFNVDIDGTRKITNLDLVAEKGHDVGFVRSFTITSDGNVDIDLSHVVENPLLNGVEIRQTNVPPASGATIQRRNYNNGTVGSTTQVSSGALNWNTVRGAFMLNGKLYTAWADGTFTRQSFDGTAYGAPVAVDTSSRITPLTDWISDIQSATGMFYDSGRIYFTRSGSSQLFYRYFTPESDVIGAKRFVASDSVAGLDFSSVRGMFTTGDALYWATQDGVLHRTDWTGGPFNAAPVPGSSTAVSGPGIDGNSWSAKALFIYQDANRTNAGTAPTAAFTASCSGPTCTFDASASAGFGRSIASYDWDFGDTTTGSGAAPSHTYDGAGTRTVTLTVTDTAGTTGTISHEVNPKATAPAVSFVGANHTDGSRSAHTVTIPAGVQAGDTLVLFMTANKSTATILAPAGWTELQSSTTSGLQARAWTRTATAASAGSTVTVTTNSALKSNLTLGAYRGGGGASISASTAAVQTTSTTSHTSPSVAVTQPGSWLVTYFGDKSAGGQTWTTPAGQTLRSTGALTGSSSTSGILVDSAVNVGTRGGLLSTTSVASGKTAMFSVVIQDN